MVNNENLHTEQMSVREDGLLAERFPCNTIPDKIMNACLQKSSTSQICEHV